MGHARLAALGLFGWILWILWRNISAYGLSDRPGVVPQELLMSWSALAFAWVVVLPVAAIEVWAATRSHRLRWISHGSVIVGTAALAWYGSLPVWLRFFDSREPVTHDQVESAVANYVVLLSGYLAIVFVLGRIARRSAQSDQT